MPFTTTTRTETQVHNHAVGKIVTSSATAAAASVICGFLPRVVRIHNLTDRISDEWYEGMAAASSLHTIATGVRTLETTNGVTVGEVTKTLNDVDIAAGVTAKVGKGFTLTATTLVASKTFYWEAIG
ncbi:MAG: hypothetical protein WC710_14825 [Gallionella sp.]|jgi:hypothetical protein